MHLSGADTHAGVEKAWIELEGIEAIVKTASKAKFFIDFHSSCLEGTPSREQPRSTGSHREGRDDTDSFSSFSCRDTALE